jgi:putative membrane protein
MQPEPLTEQRPDQPDGGQQPWLRLDRRMLLVHPIIELRRAIPALIILVFAGRSSGQGGYWGLGATGLVIAAALLRWVTTRYRITPDRLQLRKGLIRRTTIDVRRDRIRTVDITAHFMHRILGLSKVVIGTGTSDRRGAGGLELDGLDVDYAEGLRAELLHRSRAGVSTGYAGALESAPEFEREIAVFSPNWVRYAPFTLSGLITAATLLGFGFRLVQQAQINLKKVGPLHWVTAELRSTPVAIDIGAIIVVVLAFATLASVIGYVLNYWDFRLSRHSGGSLHISRGLITTRRTSIEHARLAGVEVQETLLLRLVGGARCLTIATGLRVGRGADRGGTILLPPAPRAEAIRVAADVLETGDPLSASLVPHGPRARRRRFTRAIAGAVVITAAAGLLGFALGDRDWLLWGPVLAILAVTCGCGVALARTRYRALGHTWAAGYLVSRYGAIVRRHNNLAARSIIGWNLRATIWQRRQGLVTLVATTAAGRQKYPVPDVAQPEAVRFALGGVPGLLEQFLA